MNPDSLRSLLTSLLIWSLLPFSLAHPQDDPWRSAPLLGHRSTPVERACTVPSSIAQRVFSTPADALPALVEYLVAGTPGPFERVRTIHDWIALNISYDVPMYLSGRVAAQSYQDVLRRKKGVCEGYAAVMIAMTRLAGLECRMIPGHARGAGYSVFDAESTSDENHAWNAVRINDRWWLIDATWDAGHVEGNRFVREYSSQYLFPDPHAFIYSHFPSDPSWQLLDHAKSAEEFVALPALQGEYFAWCAFPPAEWTKVFHTEGRMDLTVKPNAQALLNAEVVRYSSETEVKQPGAAFVQGDDNGNDHIALAFPHPGRYIVRIFAKRRDDPGQYRSIGFLGVECANGSIMVFPEQFAGFRENDYRLLVPMDHAVRPGVVERFVFFLPGIAKAMLQCGERQADLRSSGSGTYEGSLEIGSADEVVLWGARSPDATRYEAILRFPVDDGR